MSSMNPVGFKFSPPVSNVTPFSVAMAGVQGWATGVHGQCYASIIRYHLAENEN
jgi:hypothetical protein